MKLLEWMYWLVCIMFVADCFGDEPMSIVGAIVIGFSFGVVLLCLRGRLEALGFKRGWKHAIDVVASLRADGRLQVVERDAKGRFARG